MFTGTDVGRYYDSNHRRFLRIGTGRRAGVIHRAVWGQGVQNRLQALHFVHEIVLAELEEVGGAESARVLDLGCGTGASLRYLAANGLGSGVGISNSRLQIEGALARKGPPGCVLDFLQGDFTDPSFLEGLPFSHDEFDLVFAIESFAHIPSAEQFFATAVRYLRPGGRLVLIDDLRTEPHRSRSSRKPRAGRRAPTARAPEKGDERLLAEFERGWKLAPLRSAKQLRVIAKRAGLEATRNLDLTPHLETRTLRTGTVALTVRLLRPLSRLFPKLAARSAYWSNLRGGHALQQLLQRGAVEYRCLTFARTGPSRLSMLS